MLGKKVFISSLIGLALASCSFINLKNDLEKQKRLIKIKINIDYNRQESSQFIIALIKEGIERPSIVNYRILKNIKNIEFLEKPDMYRVIMFEDKDNNFKFSSNELIAQSKILDMTMNGSKIEILLKPKLCKNKSFYKLNDLKNITYNLERTIANIGSIISINSSNFSEENIKKGLWEPQAFSEEISYGIYLLEEYDPNKKVVLFIHGILGSPKNFSYIIDNLDKSKYQVMVAYFPTGVSINRTSQYINRVMSELKIRLKFQTISIVAHSLGGLVSRELINILSNTNEYEISTFISISTPWNGNKEAAIGIKYSSVIVPVWKDLAPNSKFLKSLYRTPLPKNIDYYLLYGFKNEKNNDGIVSISSQLREEAKYEAKLIRSFNEDHMSILSSKKVVDTINNLLTKN